MTGLIFTTRTRKGTIIKILIACEFSGRVRNAFIARGHEAISCDLLSSELPGPHIQDDVLKHLEGWDMMVAFPPCTYLTRSGARYYQGTSLQMEALHFVSQLMNAPIERIAIENPPGVISTHIRKPDDTIQPWHFSHSESKPTCLWLKGLPRLYPTNVVYNHSTYRANNLPPGPNRWKERSRTFAGIAEAMAQQWG